MSASGGEESEVLRLKTLLFAAEEARLAAAERSLQALEGWIGDPPRLEAAASRVLVEAFRRAEIDRHAELAAAVAPVVVAAIRSEIVNSRDLMVEALYPIAGRMVTAAVANAFRELIEAINQRIDTLVSTDQWRLRVRALATGRSMAEVALAEARGATCVRALLLERGAGRLIAQWRPGDAPADNPDLISGLIAAVTEFAATVFFDRRGELRALDLGASRIYVRASSRIILAAEMVGEVSRAQERELDARFLQLVERRDHNETLDEADLAAFADTRPKRRRRGGKARWAALALLAAIALGLALRGPVYRWRKDAEIAEAYRQALAADPRLAAYPVSIREDWGAGTVVVRGLAPTRADADHLIAAIGDAAAPLTVAPGLEISASEADLAAGRREIAQLVEKLASEERSIAALKAELDAQRASAAPTASQVEGVSSGLALQLQLRAQLDALRSEFDADRRSLAAVAGRSAVFFTDRDVLENPDAAARTADAVAEAVKRTGQSVRVVGYADDLGNSLVSWETSRLRAARVAKMLIDRGAPAGKVFPVGRGPSLPISDNPALRSRNRRVVFEPLYAGEAP